LRSKALPRAPRNEPARGSDMAVTAGAGITAGIICRRCPVSDLSATPREYHAGQTYRLEDAASAVDAVRLCMAHALLELELCSVSEPEAGVVRREPLGR
jgi:hypothetical protein